MAGSSKVHAQAKALEEASKKRVKFQGRNEDMEDEEFHGDESAQPHVGSRRSTRRSQRQE